MKQKIIGIFLCMLMIFSAVLLPVSQAGCPCESEKTNKLDNVYKQKISDNVEDQYEAESDASYIEQSTTVKAPIIKNRPYITLLQEDFSGVVFPPPGWIFTHSNWMSSNTNYAGGVAPEARLYFYPPACDVFRLITPSIDTTAYTDLELRFKHNLSYNASYCILKVETSTDGGSTWNTAWLINATSDISANEVVIQLTTAHGVGSSNFKIAFTFDGCTGSINWWHIDDIGLTSGEECDFIYNITAWVYEGVQPFLESAEGCGNVDDTDYDRFIVDLDDAFDSTVVGIANLSITFDDETYYGNPDSDIFITNRDADIAAWIVSNPRFELHAGKKAAETLNHTFNYTITAKGTWSPTQFFSYNIRAFGKEKYNAKKDDSYSNSHTVGAKLFKTVTESYSKSWFNNEPLNFTDYKFLSIDGKGNPKDLGIDPKPTSESQQKIVTNTVQASNRGLGFCKGWVNVLYQLTQQGILERDWEQFQPGDSNVTDGEGNKYIATYTGIDNSGGDGNPRGVTINYEAKSSNSNVKLTMNDSRLYAITFYRAPWVNSKEGNGSINATEEVKCIGEHNVSAPNNDTRFTVEVSVDCKDCPQPVLYADRNGDGIVECGQYIAWMDGANGSLPIDYKLLAAFYVTPPSGFIDSIKNETGVSVKGGVVLFGKNVTFEGYGEPSNITAHVWRSHKDGVIYTIIGSNPKNESNFTTNRLSPANPHIIKYNVLSNEGIFSPISNYSTETLVVNKPPVAYIKYIRGTVNSEGEIISLLGDPVEFSGLGIDSDGWIEEYEWSIDGTVVNDSQVFTINSTTVTVLDFGEHVVRLRVRDNHNTWSETAVKIIDIVYNPVLLVHDYLSSPKSMLAIQEELEAEGFDVYSIDLRKPIAVKLDVSLPLKVPGFKVILGISEVYHWVKELKSTWKEFAALKDGKIANLEDARQKVLQALSGVRDAIVLIQNAMSKADNPDTDKIIKQIDENLSAIQQKLYLLDTSQFPTSFDDLIDMLKQKLTVTLNVADNKELILKNFSIPIPLPEKIVPVVMMLLEMGDIKIPGEATLFSKVIPLKTKGIEAEVGFKLKAKNIKVVLNKKDNKIMASATLAISDINVDVKVGLGLISKSESDSAVWGLEPDSTRAEDKPWTFFKDGYLVRFSKEIGDDESVFNGALDVGITTGKVSKASVGLTIGSDSRSSNSGSSNEEESTEKDEKGDRGVSEIHMWDWRAIIDLDINNALSNGLSPATWTPGDYTTSIKDQYHCGSCWAHAALASLESKIKIVTGQPNPDLPIDLSEQYLLSCYRCNDDPKKNKTCLDGCRGAFAAATATVIRDNKAILERDFRYKGIDNKGRTSTSQSLARAVYCFDPIHNPFGPKFNVNGFKRVNSSKDKKYPSRDDIKQALIEHGPLFVDAIIYDNGEAQGSWGLYPYEYKKYDDLYEYNGVWNRDGTTYSHALCIVGYHDDTNHPSKGYWVVKNSNGKNWGLDRDDNPWNVTGRHDGGWCKIKYGCCDIEKNLFYFNFNLADQPYSALYYLGCPREVPPPMGKTTSGNDQSFNDPDDECIPCKNNNPSLEENQNTSQNQTEGCIKSETQVIEYPELKISLELDSSIIKLKLANGDLKAYAGEVGEEIDKIKKETGMSKVSLVGNGMGGNIVHWYTNYGYRGDVDKLILIGAPIHGSDIADYGPKAIKILIKLLTSILPAGGALIAKIANMAVDIILGDAITQMVPHSSFINALNQNDEKCPAPRVPILWEPENENATTNPNVKYLTIYGTAPNVGDVVLPLTLIHLHTRVAGYDYKVPFIWSGDLFTVKRSAILYDEDNNENIIVKSVKGTHWQLPKREDTIDYIKQFLEGTITTTMLNDYREDDFNVSYDVLRNQSSQWSDQIEDFINNSQIKLHNITLDNTVTNASFSIQYNPIDAYWNNTYQIYEFFSNDLNLSLIDPNNVEITPADAITNESIQYNKSSEDGIILYRIKKPMAGNWSITVKAVNIESASNTTSYSVFSAYDTTLRLAVGTNKSSYKPKEKINISATLHYDGIPQIGANVTAYIKKVINASNDTGVIKDKIYLHDNENGNYSGFYSNTSLQGIYYVNVVASVLIEDKKINRSASTTVWIEALPDLTLSQSNISFSNETPVVVGEKIFINATIHNVGDGNATNAKIEFRDNLTTIGYDVINITTGGKTNASIQWEATFGNHVLGVIISPFNAFLEKNYTNNSATKPLNVGDNEPPIAWIGQNQITRNNTPIFFDGSMSSDNVGIVRYAWDLDNKTDSNEDGIFDNDPDLTEVYNSTRGYNKTGIYNVTLTVYDATGNSANDTITVNVVEETEYDQEAPFAIAGSNQEVMVEEPLYLDGSLSIENYGIASHLWDIDIGTDSDFNGIPDDDVDYITKHPYLEHGYPFPGTYIVKLTVDDVAGNGPTSDYTLVIVKDHIQYECMGDKDCDGIFDEEDNCPECWNPDQADYDQDGIGDCCYCKKIVTPFDDAQYIIDNANDGDVICLVTGAFYDNTHLNINRNNIIIDGHGATLYGNGTGECIICNAQVKNVIVQNCQITNYGTGVKINGDVFRNKFKNNVVYKNIDYGFNILGGGAELIDNIICNNSLDINNPLGSPHGDDNTCNTTNGWNDEGCIGCTFNCFNCTIPTDGMNITRNTLLCPGIYYLPNGINIKADDITVKGDSTVLIGSLRETFPPENWVIHNYADAGSWELEETCGVYEPPTATEFYAQANSIKNSSKVFDVGLRTPGLNLAGYTSVKLELDRNFQNPEGLGHAEIRTYSDGTLKQTLWGNSSSDPSNGVHMELTFDPSTYNNPSNVSIEFYYTTNGFTKCGKFAIDNVKVTHNQNPILGPEGFLPTQSIGVNIHGHSLVKIKDIEIRNYYTGINFSAFGARDMGYDSFIENKIVDNVEGIRIKNSMGNNISNNEISNNLHYGLILDSSDGCYANENIIANNTFENNLNCSILLLGEHCKTNIIRENILTNGLRIQGGSQTYGNKIIHNTIRSTTSQEAVYVDNTNNNLFEDNEVYDALLHGFFVKNSHYNVFKNNYVHDVAVGFLIDGNHNRIENGTIEGVNNGISIDNSEYNTISNNTLNKNNFISIYLNNTSHTKAYNNIFSNIFIDNSSYNNILYNSATEYYTTSNNIVTKQDSSINLENSHDNNITGNYNANIELINCTNNYIINNTESSQIFGIVLVNSSDNTISGNNITSNSEYGIVCNSSNNNTIYNNYFCNINNSYDDGVNKWNTTKTYTYPKKNIIGGHYFGGNYWCDYSGVDIDSDGLGDTLLPYNSSGGIQNGGDWLPLVLAFWNYPPYTPSNPSPSDGATGVSVDTDLSWTGGDPDEEDTVTYDIYFGTTSSPLKIVSNHSATNYEPGALDYGTTYYWKIVAWDNHGVSTAGPLWNFTTESCVNDVGVTAILSPTNGAIQTFTPKVNVKNFELLNQTDVPVKMDIAKYGMPSTIVFDGFENYTSGVFIFPPGWTIQTTNPTGTWYMYASSTTYSASTYPRVQEATSDGNAQDESLISPTIDCSALTTVNLMFTKYYYHYTGDVGSFTVYGSNDNGATWPYTLATYTATSSTAENIDISTWAAGQNDVKIKFRFQSAADTGLNSYLYFDNFWVGTNAPFGPMGDNPPAGWQIVNYPSNPSPWTNNFWHRYTSTYTSYDSIGYPARIYYTSPYQDVNCSLITPSINCSGLSTVKLYLNGYFYYYATNPGRGYIEVSTNGGSTWTDTGAITTATRYFYEFPGYNDIDITTWAAGQSNVKIRFRYEHTAAEQGRYWYIGNVRVGDGSGSYIFYDSFQGPQAYSTNFKSWQPDNWITWTPTIISGTVNWQSVVSGTSPTCTPHGGARMAFYNSYSATAGSQAFLKSIPYDVSSSIALKMKFWMFHDSVSYQTTADKIDVMVSTNGINWTNVGTYYRSCTLQGLPLVDGWREWIIDLSGYEDETALQIGFLATSQYGYNMFIDDVELFGLGLITEYTQTVYVNINPDQTVEVVFPVWSPSDVGQYIVTACTMLYNDCNPSNDCMSEIIDLTMDNTPPVISDVTATPATQVKGGWVNITASVTDNIEVDEVYLYIEYPDGVIKSTLTKVDGSKSISTKRNTIENFSITQNKTGDTYYCNKTYSTIGVHTYHIWANDTSGNQIASANHTFTIINTPPNTPSQPSGPVSGYICILYNYSTSATDPDGDQVFYMWDWGDGNYSGWIGPYNSGATCTASHIWTNPNTYQIRVKAKDTYGNESSWSLLLTVTIANHPPNTPSAPNPASGATSVDINADLSWTGGDPDTCDTVTYDVYFGTTSPPPKIVSNQSATIYDPGTMNYNSKYYWKIVAWDNHGVSSAGPTWNFTTILGDNTPPVTNITLDGTVGNNGWYISTVIITLMATDDQSGVAHTFYKIDGGVWIEYTMPVQINLDGECNISYYSVDNAGNSETPKTATLKIDRTPPNITLTKEQINILTVKFTAQVSDATSGIDRVEFYLDGVIQYNDTQSPYEWTWMGVGDHTVTAKAFDMAGNLASSSMSTPYVQSQEQNLVVQKINKLIQKVILRQQTTE